MKKFFLFALSCLEGVNGLLASSSDDLRQTAESPLSSASLSSVSGMASDEALPPLPATGQEKRLPLFRDKAYPVIDVPLIQKTATFSSSDPSLAEGQSPSPSDRTSGEFQPASLSPSSSEKTKAFASSDSDFRDTTSTDSSQSPGRPRSSSDSDLASTTASSSHSSLSIEGEHHEAIVVPSLNLPQSILNSAEPQERSEVSSARPQHTSRPKIQPIRKAEERPSGKQSPRIEEVSDSSVKPAEREFEDFDESNISSARLSSRGPQYPICTSGQGIIEGLPAPMDSLLLQQIRSRLNPIVLVYNAAQPAATVAVQEEPRPTGPRPELTPRHQDPLILSEGHQDRIEWVNTHGNASIAAERVVITTGSLLSFGGSGMISNTIRKFSKDPNPLGLSHVGLALVASANEIIALIERSAYNGGLHFLADKGKHLKSSMIETIQEECRHHMGEADVFCLHSTGEEGVHIEPLSTLVNNYEGNIFVRPLKTPIALVDLLEIIIRDVGKEYNFDIKQFAKSINNKNKKEQNNKRFCSQLVADIYKEFDIIDSTLMGNNVVPAEFCSHSTSDLLKDYAEAEKVLKIYINYQKGCGCCLLM